MTSSSKARFFLAKTHMEQIVDELESLGSDGTDLLSVLGIMMGFAIETFDQKDREDAMKDISSFAIITAEWLDKEVKG